MTVVPNQFLPDPTIDPATTSREPPLNIATSRNFPEWMATQGVSLAFTTYQSNRLFFLGLNAQGQLAAFERLFDRPMGLYASPWGDQLYLSTRYQIWRFENVLDPGQIYKGGDRLYVPRQGFITGDLDIHDLAIDSQGKLVFINTTYNCLATLSDRHSFKPLWMPPFITKLAAEDRCHLNGLALVDGQPRYATAVSQSDIVDSWREKRQDSGCVLDIPANQVVATGLSMPHSPRWYRDRLWVLNSGHGELGWIDLEQGQFQPLTFCPGYVRGLAFWGDYALVGLSKPRDKTFQGLALDGRLQAAAVDARCGLYVIDLRTGDIVQWLHLEGVITELYDVQVLPGIQRPTALGFKTNEIAQLITTEPLPGQGQVSVV